MEEVTGFSLDLSLESHRDYLRRCVEEIIIPYTESMTIPEREKKRLYDEHEHIKSNAVPYGCGCGCGMLILCISLAGAEIAETTSFNFFALLISGLTVYGVYKCCHSKSLEEEYRRKLALINRQIEDLKHEMEEAILLFHSSQEL